MRLIKSPPRNCGTAQRGLVHPDGTGPQARLPAILPAGLSVAGHGTLLAPCR